MPTLPVVVRDLNDAVVPVADIVFVPEIVTLPGPDMITLPTNVVAP